MPAVRMQSIRLTTGSQEMSGAVCAVFRFKS